MSKNIFRAIKRRFKRQWVKYESNQLKKKLSTEKIIGFGFNRLPYAETGESGKKKPEYDVIAGIIDTYMNKDGLKYFETGYNYMRYQSERIVRQCLVERYNRNDYILCDKLPVRNKVVKKKSYDKIFKGQLKECGVSYFDVYLIHNVNRAWYEEEGERAFSFVKSIKAQGKTKLTGFSFHDKAETLEKILTEHPEIDIVQLQINYQDWESDAIQSRKCYEVARRHKKIITVMEPLKGGNLVNRLPEEAKKVINDAGWTPASFGLKFVLGKKGISVVLSGMGTASQAAENISTVSDDRTFSEKDLKITERVLELILQEREIDCTNCGYCLDVCPKRIPISSIFQLINNETKEGKIINRNAKLFYRSAVSNQGKCSDCISCAKCEEVCSQLLPIRDYLNKAEKIFE